jgi:hypothetical protein
VRNAGAARRFSQGKRLDPALLQKLARRLQQRRTQVAVVVCCHCLHNSLMICCQRQHITIPQPPQDARPGGKNCTLASQNKDSYNRRVWRSWGPPAQRKREENNE